MNFFSFDLEFDFEFEMYFAVNSCALIVLSFSVFKLNECHPSGAPDSVCDDLVPHHGAQPQTEKSPFVLKGLQGFAIQARLANATSGTIGKFVAKGQEAHTITCFESPDVSPHKN